MEESSLIVTLTIIESPKAPILVPPLVQNPQAMSVIEWLNFSMVIFLSSFLSICVEI